MADVSKKAGTLFYSYAPSPKDEVLREELEKHLVGLQRKGLIESWSRREIVAGKSQQEEIDKHLEAASVILLLISPDFLASDYYYGAEMMRAMERHHAGDAHVIPILLRPVYLEDEPFTHLASLPTNGKPISMWRNRDAAFAEVAKEISKVIRELPEGQVLARNALHLLGTTDIAERVAYADLRQFALLLHHARTIDATQLPLLLAPLRQTAVLQNALVVSGIYSIQLLIFNVASIDATYIPFIQQGLRTLDIAEKLEHAPIKILDSFYGTSIDMLMRTQHGSIVNILIHTIKHCNCETQHLKTSVSFCGTTRRSVLMRNYSYFVIHQSDNF